PRGGKMPDRDWVQLDRRDLTPEQKSRVLADATLAAMSDRPARPGTAERPPLTDKQARDILRGAAAGESEAPTPDEVLADHPGAKKSGRLYSTSTPRGEFPEGTAEKQAEYHANAIRDTSEAMRRAQEAGDIAEVQRLDDVARRLNAGYRTTGRLRKWLEEKNVLPPPGVRDEGAPVGRN